MGWNWVDDRDVAYRVVRDSFISDTCNFCHKELMRGRMLSGNKISLDKTQILESVFLNSSQDSILFILPALVHQCSFSEMPRVEKSPLRPPDEKVKEIVAWDTGDKPNTKF